MTDSDIQISVVIPAYNSAQYLKACIESLQKQSFQGFEVIIVDDGSTDNTYSVAQSLIKFDNRIRYFAHSNSGVSASRNVGIENARGKYIVFIDGDDTVEATHLEQLIKGLDKTECSMCLMKIIRDDQVEISESRKQIFDTFPIITHQDFNKLFESYLLSSPCDKIYNKGILNRYHIRFNEYISYAEDLDFNLRYFKHIDSISLNPTPTYCYIKHPGSATSRAHNRLSFTIAELCKSASGLLGTDLTPKSALIILEHILWSLLNAFHPKQILSPKQRKAEISSICAISLYQNAIVALPLIKINPLLKFALRSRKPSIISAVIKLALRK